MAKKKSLKTALNVHHAKMFKQKHNQAMEAQKTATVKSKGKGKEKVVAAKKSVIPYGPEDAILLVGEGDFSFAHALISGTGTSKNKAPHCYPANITATTFDSEPTCYEKYPWAKETVKMLQQAGIQVLFKVDATKLESDKRLKGRKFDRVVFNFPHTGKGITDQDRNILSNQQLLVGFFAAAPGVLKHGSTNIQRVNTKRKKVKRKNAGMDEDSEEDVVSMDEDLYSDAEADPLDRALGNSMRGTILITLRNSSPYTLWNMPDLAKKPQNEGPRYKQLRSFAFRLQDYPGYAHRRTAGHRGEREIPVLKEKDGISDARTWEFELA